MTTVTDAQIAAYLPMIEEQARRLRVAGVAEYDDLRQEGMISVWKALEFNHTPSKEVVVQRMLNWVRYCRRWVNQQPPIEGGDGLHE